MRLQALGKILQILRAGRLLTQPQLQWAIANATAVRRMLYYFEVQLEGKNNKSDQIKTELKKEGSEVDRLLLTLGQSR